MFVHWGFDRSIYQSIHYIHTYVRADLLLLLLYFTTNHCRFLGFVEFIETFNAGTEEAFDVKITGEWLLRENQPTLLQVDPENIEYGSSYTMAEQAPVVAIGGGVSQVASWQSLGPIKLLDITYLTPNMYIARGNFKADAIFVWKRKE